MPVRGGRPRATGDRGAAHRRARPPRRAGESIRDSDPHGCPRPGGPGTIRRLALLQGPLVRGRLSPARATSAACTSPPTSLPARTPSSVSTRRTTSPANSSTSPARRRSSGTAWELNPFIYALSGELGYRRYDNGDSTGLLGPRGRPRAPDRKTRSRWDSLPPPGVSPSEATAPDPRSRRTSSASTTSSTAVSPSRSTVPWRSTGASPPPSSPSESGVAWALTSPKFAGGPLIEHHARKSRADGRNVVASRKRPTGASKAGRPPGTWESGSRPSSSPIVAIEDRQYGEGGVRSDGPLGPGPLGRQVPLGARRLGVDRRPADLGRVQPT